MYKRPITLPREVGGQELADAVERAAKSLQGYEVGVLNDIGYKPGSFQKCEIHRSISIDPKRSRSGEWLSKLPRGSYFLFEIDLEETYRELLNKGTLTPKWGQRWEKHKPAFEAFPAELYRQLEQPSQA